MNLLKLVESFESGVDIKEEFYLQHKTEGTYIKLAFDNDNNDEEFRDVYVYESKEITLKEDLSTNTFTYPEGTRLLVEVNYETPTLYGHELNCEKLIQHLEENFERLSTPKTFISNMDDEWEYFEELL